MKSILMSIQPKWCKAIVHDSCYINEDAYGAVDKLVVRKTRPKEKDLPIDVYIYCCEPHKKAYRQTGQSCKTGYYTYPPYNRPYGKVFAKFTLNEVVDIEHKTMLYKKDKVKHAKGKPLYGWKIDNLTIFDKPKELGAFKGYCNKKRNWKCNSITRPPQSWQYVQELEEYDENN